MPGGRGSGILSNSMSNVEPSAIEKSRGWWNQLSPAKDLRGEEILVYIITNAKHDACWE